MVSSFYFIQEEKGNPQIIIMLFKLTLMDIFKISKLSVTLGSFMEAFGKNPDFQFRTTKKPLASGKTIVEQVTNWIKSWLE